MNPFITIWIKPGETFNYLGERCLAGKENHIDYLFVLGAISMGFPVIHDMFNHADGFILSKFMLAITLTPVVGLLFSKYILSYLIWKLGKVFQGKATFAEVQLVMAYSMIPVFLHLVIAFIFIIPAFLLRDVDMLLLQHPATNFVIGIFICRNLVYGLSRFNHFTYGYAILNFVILTAMFEVIRLLIVK